MDPNAFADFRKFVYTGVRPELPFDEARKLWVVANRFLSSTLEKMCEGVIIQELRREVELRSTNGASKALIECLTFAHHFSMALLFRSCQLYVRGSLWLIGATEEWHQFEAEHPEVVARVLQA